MLDRTFREFHANIFRLKYFIVRTEEEGKGRESIDRGERDSTPSRTFPDEEIVAWGVMVLHENFYRVVDRKASRRRRGT